METTESSTIQKAADLLGKLRAGIGEAVVGQSRVVEEVVLALVASGHVLIEGVPGLGKVRQSPDYLRIVSENQSWCP